MRGKAMGALLMWSLIVGLFIMTAATFGWIGAVAWAIAWHRYLAANAVGY
jgi:hypothetical protein